MKQLKPQNFLLKETLQKTGNDGSRHSKSSSLQVELMKKRKRYSVLSSYTWLENKPELFIILLNRKKDKIEVLKAKFKSYCKPRTNLTYIRHQFFTRTQGPLESTDIFVADLKNKAKDCKFERLTESLIKDRGGIRRD